MKYLFHLFLELSLAPNTCWMTQRDGDIIFSDLKGGGAAEITVLP